MIEQDKANKPPKQDYNKGIGKSVQSCHDMSSKINVIGREWSMEKVDLEGRGMIEDDIFCHDNYGGPSDVIKSRKRVAARKKPLRSHTHYRKVHIGVQKNSKDKESPVVQ